MAKSHFSTIDIAIAIFSLVTYIVDIGTDVAAGVLYFSEGKELYGWLTVAFVLGPAIVMSVFSLTWHVHDKTVKPMIVLLHILPLAPVQRYVRVVHLGLMSRKTQKVVLTQRALRAQNDVSILRLIEAFMESAPQLVLQLYIMVMSQRIDWLMALVAGSSLLSLSWSMTAYNDSLRKAHSSRYQQRLPRLIWHWGWQLFMTGSRIAAFVFLACIIDQWLFAVMGGHWFLAFLWIAFKGTDFGNNFCEKWMFRVVCAFIYIFVFLNLNDGVSRWRVTAFYIVIFIENAAMASVYLASPDGGNLMILSCATVFGGFVIGLMCMLIYYGFFHPSGRRVHLTKPFKSKSRMFSANHTSVMFSPGGGVQVFNIESQTPTTTPIGMKTVNCESKKRSSQASIHGRPRGLDLSSKKSGNITALSSASQRGLQQIWRTDIQSSSSESSSLSSLSLEEERRNKLEDRPLSRNSDKSDNSATSDNCLLPALTRNDLSKSSPEKSLKNQMRESVLMRKNFSGEVNGSDSVNIHNTDSPTLSRGSWTRLSDYRHSQGAMDEIVTLAFDDSSSTDRRGSDSSSHDSRPKSLSPLDVASLWHHAHGKLKRTIAATIAAATGTASSNECTPNQSKCTSHNTTTSSQNSSLSQNSSFIEAHNGIDDRNDASEVTLNGSANNGRQKEASCSLPDILEAVENEPNSGTSGGSKTPLVDMTRQKRVKSESPFRRRDHRTPSPGPTSNRKGAENSFQSPYAEDSTLTASKLLNERPKSYFHHANSRQRHSNKDSTLMEGEGDAVVTSSQHAHEMEFSQDWTRGPEANKGPSPFTDQELVTVMANSLKSYMGYSTPTSSNNRGREGLALTIDDLRFSPDSTSNLGGTVTRTRSASSLFHESENSSPSSSASKMQRQVEVTRGDDDELSPNALKHIEDFPTSFTETLDIQGIPNSQALNILRRAYANSLAANSQVRTVSPRDRSNDFTHNRGRDQGEIHPKRSRRREGREIKERGISEYYQDENKSPLQGACAMQESEKYYDDTSPYPLEGDLVLFDSIAWQKSKLKKGKNVRRGNGRVSAGRSSTKRLNVHGSSFQMNDYSSSPHRLGNTLEVAATDSPSERYVKGRYCPPLCQGEENILSRNLDKYMRPPLDLDSKRKQILALADGDNLGAKRLDLSDEDDIEYLRREIIRRDRRRSQQESDFFNLHMHDQEPSPRRKYSSISQPNLKRSSRPLSPRKKSYMEECWRSEAPLDNSQPSISYRNSTRSSSQGRSFDHSYGFGSPSHQELETSASHIVDYFSQALDSQNRRFSYDPSLHRRRGKHLSQPNLRVHGSRQPLRSINNSSDLDK